MPIGVLALQGDFREHISTLERLGAEVIAVRTVQDLDRCSALVIPGGESTTMQNLSMAYGLFEPIKAKIKAGMPVLGTCAGLIMLSNEILDGTTDQFGFGGLDVAVRRNAFGNQLDSFETDLEFSGVDSPIHAAFIRAPVVERVGKGVEVLSTLSDGRVVAVKSGNLIGIAFHPEVTGELRIHQYFLDLVAKRKAD